MTNAKRIFGALVIAAALFAFWPFVFNSWREVSALKDAIAEREALLAKRVAILANVEKEYAEYEKVTATEEGKMLTQIVPVDKQVAEVVTALTDMAQQSGGSLVEVSASEPKAKSADAYRIVEFNTSLTASYAGMRDYLRRAEEYVRLMNVKSIEASADPRSPGLLRFVILADVYFIP